MMMMMMAMIVGIVAAIHSKRKKKARKISSMGLYRKGENSYTQVSIN